MESVKRMWRKSSRELVVLLALLILFVVFVILIPLCLLPPVRRQAKLEKEAAAL